MPVTNEEFQLAAAHTQLHSRSREAAFRILVLDMAPGEVGKALGMWRQAVTRAARRVEAEVCPPGWEWVNVPLPPGRAREIREEAEELREQTP